MDFDHLFPFKIPISLLKVFGLWITDKFSPARLIYGTLTHLLVYEAFTLSEIICLFDVKSFEELTKLLTYLPTYVAAISKTINIITNSKQIRQLFIMIDEIVEEVDDKQELRRQLTVVERVFKVCLSFAFTATFLGGLQGFSKLPYVMWFPWDENGSQLGHAFAALYQLFDGVICALLTTSVDFIPVMFMCYAGAFIDALCKRLEALKAKKGGEEEFVKCIKLHENIKIFVNTIQKTFSTVLFVQSFFSSLILCIIAISLTTVSLNLLRFRILFHIFL